MVNSKRTSCGVTVSLNSTIKRSIEGNTKTTKRRGTVSFTGHQANYLKVGGATASNRGMGFSLKVKKGFMLYTRMEIRYKSLKEMKLKKYLKINRKPCKIKI